MHRAPIPHPDAGPVRRTIRPGGPIGRGGALKPRDHAGSTPARGTTHAVDTRHEYCPGDGPANRFLQARGSRRTANDDHAPHVAVAQQVRAPPWSGGAGGSRPPGDTREAGQAVASIRTNGWPRNVRAPQGTVVVNGNPAEAAGQYHREQTARRRRRVRVKRCGKSAPAARVTGTARQTPPGARPERARPARPMRTGRPLELAGDGGPR